MLVDRYYLITATLTVFLTGILFVSDASAQISAVTFSRTATGETGIGSIEFTFDEQDDVLVQIDQLGAVDALFQNNDTFGQDFGIEAGGPVDSIGQVAIGQVLSAGTNFGSTSLNVTDFIAPGENFFLGFSSGADVGYFNIEWDAIDDGSIFYSSGQFASSGFALTVNAVPEPSSTLLISVLGALVVVRRRS